jgi:hypothetical protein
MKDIKLNTPQFLLITIVMFLMLLYLVDIVLIEKNTESLSDIIEKSERV